MAAASNTVHVEDACDEIAKHVSQGGEVSEVLAANAFFPPMMKHMVNLTELYQVISKTAATTQTRIVTSEQLPLRLRDIQHWPKLAEYLAGQEKQYVEMVLNACRGDKARTAAVLGVPVERLG